MNLTFRAKGPVTLIKPYLSNYN